MCVLRIVIPWLLLYSMMLGWETAMLLRSGFDIFVSNLNFTVVSEDTKFEYLGLSEYLSYSRAHCSTYRYKSDGISKRDNAKIWESQWKEFQIRNAFRKQETTNHITIYQNKKIIRREHLPLSLAVAHYGLQMGWRCVTRVGDHIQSMILSRFRANILFMKPWREVAEFETCSLQSRMSVSTHWSCKDYRRQKGYHEAQRGEGWLVLRPRNMNTATRFLIALVVEVYLYFPVLCGLEIGRRISWFDSLIYQV